MFSVLVYDARLCWGYQDARLCCIFCRHLHRPFIPPTFPPSLQPSLNPSICWIVSSILLPTHTLMHTHTHAQTQTFKVTVLLSQILESVTTMLPNLQPKHSFYTSHGCLIIVLSTNSVLRIVAGVAECWVAG